MTEVKEKTWLERGRISPRDVLEAYRETEFIPCRLRYFRIRDDMQATGCGLTAMAASIGKISDFGGGVVERVMQDFGLSKSYIDGFVDGFDNDRFIGMSGDVEQERKGWRDGRRSARFCFAEGA